MEALPEDAMPAPLSSPPSSPSLAALEQRDDFLDRHIGPSASEIAAMLASINASSLEQLVEQTVPPAIRLAAPLALAEPRPEGEALAALRAIARRNRVQHSMIGMGYADTLTPTVVLRNVLENPGWYTAYTPYQAELAQGRLEALLNYQQMVIDLTGLELANASLLDEATAAAEAMSMARRVSKAKSQRFFVDAACFPQTIDVLRTRAAFFDFELVFGTPEEAAQQEVFGALFQYPNDEGEVSDLSGPIAAVKSRGGVVAVASDLMALVLLRSPGEMGADIALGSSQRFGIPLGFGGPHAAFFATRDEHKRSVAGRIIGVLDRRPRQAGAAYGAADPRTAHPAREGQLEHLHVAGSACQHGRHVRRLPRPARSAQHRRSHPPPGRDSGAGTAARRNHRHQQALFRQPAHRPRQPCAERLQGRGRSRLQPAPGLARRASRMRSMRRPHAPTSRLCSS
jgi:hypothetical protein